jgi:hypothetical protein
MTHAVMERDRDARARSFYVTKRAYGRLAPACSGLKLECARGKGARGKLNPDAVVDNRRKVGFNAPIQDLLDITEATTRKWILADGPIFELVDRNRIESLIGDNRLSNSRSKLLFSFVSSRLFL